MTSRKLPPVHPDEILQEEFLGPLAGDTSARPAWRFGEMTAESAQEILAWHYDGEYAFYDMAADPDDAAEFVEPDRWRLRPLEPAREVVLQATNESGELQGFFSFQGSTDECTIGLGLAPPLTGRSLGLSLIEAGLAFAVRRWGVRRFRLEVAAFNVRATKVYERAGFIEVARFDRALHGVDVTFVEMQRGGERST